MLEFDFLTLDEPLFSVSECIKNIDRGPKQGVNNGENDARKKAS